MRAFFKIFRSSYETWPTLFNQASAFASQVGQDRVISISHSADQGHGVVVVWYWGLKDLEEVEIDDDGIRGPDQADLIDMGSDEEEDKK